MTEGNTQQRVLVWLNMRDTKRAVQVLTDDFLNTHHILTLRDTKNPEMWIYTGAIYKPEGETYIKEYVKQNTQELFNKHIYNEVINTIQALTYIDAEELFKEEDPNKICLLNGVYDIKTKTIEPHQPRYTNKPKYKFFSQIPIKYNPNSQCLQTRKFISDIVKRPEDVLVVQELFGYLLLRNFPIQKGIMLLGTGSNGKGTLLRLLQHFIGIDNTVCLSLQEICHDRFALSQLFKKHLCNGGDLPDADIKNSARFKNITGGDYISGDRKHRSRVEFTNYAKPVFAANKLPKSVDDSYAYMRRWVFLEFPKTFKSQKDLSGMPEKTRHNYCLAIPDFESSLFTEEELSGILNWGLEGLDRLLKQGRFSDERTVEENTIMYKRKSDSLGSFLDDCFDLGDMESRIPKKKFFEAYLEYCKMLDLRPVNDVAIGKFMREKFVVSERVKIDGLKVYCWVGLSLKDADQVDWVDYGFSNISKIMSALEDNSKSVVHPGHSVQQLKIEEIDVSEPEKPEFCKREKALDLFEPQKLYDYSDVVMSFVKFLGLNSNEADELLEVLLEQGGVYKPKPDKYQKLT